MKRWRKEKEQTFGANFLNEGLLEREGKRKSEGRRKILLFL